MGRHSLLRATFAKVLENKEQAALHPADMQLSCWAGRLPEDSFLSRAPLRH